MKKTPANNSKTRRTAKSGGAPAKSFKKPGNSGYAGYEYQIDVTVWVALDLMLAKKATDVVAIEPVSHEDIEAAVKDPAVAHLGLTANGKQLNLVVQAKTRSGSPWTAPAIADVLLGKKIETTTARTRPLLALQQDALRRYVFITNESSVDVLRPHEAEHLFDFPEVNELPPHTRDGLSDQERASLAPRISLLTGMTREVLDGRIAKILSRHGHIATSRHADCVKDLREVVRKRMMGEAGGLWGCSELIDLLANFGGSVAPTRDMDHYVKPGSFEAIRSRLDLSHAVVIDGPSGTGKTLTAEILEHKLRSESPPYEVVGEELGPGYVRGRLMGGGQILFQLRDPWGSNRLIPGADRWSGELPKLLASANANRKFLVTSRSDVLRSAGPEVVKQLQPHIVSIDESDYGAVRLGEIYDNIASDLKGFARDLAKQYRQKALRTLTRPYEIKRFLDALSRENIDKPRKIEDLLRESQIEAISKVIAEQIAPFGTDGVESAAVVWSLLVSRTTIAREAFAKLGRRMRTAIKPLRPDVDGLIDFLVAGQNLRQDGPTLSFYHPRVEDGLRMTFMRQPRDAESALNATVELLLAWDDAGQDWGLETGLGVLRSVDRIEGISLELSSAATDRLDVYLEELAFSNDEKADFGHGLQDLARFGSKKHTPSQLARILLRGAPSAKRAMPPMWRAPALTEEDMVALRNDKNTVPMIHRFIAEVLPYSTRQYHVELIPLLYKLAGDLERPFWSAFEAVADPSSPFDNLTAIVAGVLAAPEPKYDAAIERLALSEAKADAWLDDHAKDTYQAEEHVVDASAADHIFEQPSDQFYNARTGLERLVRIRRGREGIEWIATNPHRTLLLRALAEVLSSRSAKPSLQELEFLLKNAEDWVRSSAWQAAQVHWNHALTPYLLSELSRVDVGGGDYRRSLIEIAALNSNSAKNDPLPTLYEVVARASYNRRLELLYDLATCKLDDDPTGDEGRAIREQRIDRLVELFDGDDIELAQAVGSVLQGLDIDAVVAGLGEKSRLVLERLLGDASVDLLGPLTYIAAFLGMNIETALRRLMSSGDAADGEIAINAMHVAGGETLRPRLQAALKHKRYPVRRRALRDLAPEAVISERHEYLLLAKDESAEVRKAFANLMEEYKWPEAIGALTQLLDDVRNYASVLGNSWPNYSVARAAAKALGAYESLPSTAIDALLEIAKANTADPFVASAAATALADKDDDRITPTFLSLLSSAGLPNNPSYRPKSQAAAWALSDRAASDKLTHLDAASSQVAETESHFIAGPLLTAFGRVHGGLRTELMARLEKAGEFKRLELLRLSAVILEETEGLRLSPREVLLSRLLQEGSLLALNDNEQNLLKSWSMSLDVQTGFDRYLAFLAHAVFDLPLASDPIDVREFHLPERFAVMTLRSLTPFKEEEFGVDDGT